jgi:threonine/homoserine/homoserine lactone efflux protein
VLYVVSRGIQQGRPAGLASALSVGVGNFGQVIAATLGLSALLASSALAFSVVKFAGAAYLIFLGIRTLLARSDDQGLKSVQATPIPRIFRQGVFVSLFNPKTAIFFLAFLPQFVDPTRGPVAGQVFLLGCLFVVLGVCTDSMYAFAAGTIGSWLRQNPRLGSVRRYVTGGIFVSLGLTTAFAGPHRK